MVPQPRRCHVASLPPPPPGSVRCRCLVTASWPPTQGAAGGTAAGLGAAVAPPSHPRAGGLGGVPGVSGHPLTPLLPAEALVNSQEWTLGRSVPEIRLVGTVSHGPAPCPGGPAPCPGGPPAVLMSPLSSPQGVLGSSKSGKSALVHRFLTGSYVGLEPTESEWPWDGGGCGVGAAVGLAMAMGHAWP